MLLDKGFGSGPKDLPLKGAPPQTLPLFHWALRDREDNQPLCRAPTTSSIPPCASNLPCLPDQTRLHQPVVSHHSAPTSSQGHRQSPGVDGPSSPGCAPSRSGTPVPRRLGGVRAWGAFLGSLQSNSGSLPHSGLSPGSPAPPTRVTLREGSRLQAPSTHPGHGQPHIRCWASAERRP